MRLTVYLVIFIQLIFKILLWWVVASVIVSTIKAVSKDCDKRYGIEKVFEKVLDGNWFCPTHE